MRARPFRAALIAALIGCAGCGETRADGLPATGSGLRVINPGSPLPIIACTHAVFVKRFPRLRTRSVAHPMTSGIGDAPCVWRITEVNGCFDPATLQCWFVCADPNRLDDEELLRMEHERAHRVQALEGWEMARPLWQRLRERAPGMITHPEIARLLD
jgi:hypothetical protein